jgi:tripartite-type tricarboxylate transporter receptor subunit TctC
MDHLLYRACRIKAGAILTTVLLIMLARGALADDVENFYRGRTLTVLTGYSVGGGYDLYTRVLARYLGRYIPGHPAVVPSNMPGAGGLRASNYLYEAAPKDGTVIGTFSRSIPTMPLVTPTAVSFDGRKFSWIGSMSSDTSLCLTGANHRSRTSMTC